MGGWVISGNIDMWHFQTFDLKTVPGLGNVCGQSQVWIGFTFGSNSSITDSGVYVDDIVLSKLIREDSYEENDTLATAWNFSLGENQWLSSYGGSQGVQRDDDWYRIQAISDNQPITVQYNSLPEAGNIDMEMYSSNGEIIAMSTSSGPVELMHMAKTMVLSMPASSMISTMVSGLYSVRS